VPGEVTATEGMLSSKDAKRKPARNRLMIGRPLKEIRTRIGDPSSPS
jgi:hypothetical protein